MPFTSNPTPEDTTVIVGNIVLIDSEGEPAMEAEIPEDPNRWTLPAIREATAVALLAFVTAPLLFAALGHSRTGGELVDE